MKSILFATAAAAGLFIAGGTAANADQNSNSNVQQTQVASTNTITVQSGDSLWSLAQKHNVSLDSLEQANNNVSNNTIYVGEKLVLPTDSQQVVLGDNVQSQPQNQTQSAQTNNQTQSAQTNNQNQSTNNYTTSSSDNSAKEWIASHESTGSYEASNGQYYGRYQISKASLNGDYSQANQEKVADQYVNSRYGSWENAKSFWQQNGWY
ncbi:LysM peptidoglycan-binding domain-containing protein [Apilactobacillus apisilvae]|uniref:LysM peptidoglycan-binding domain-containing protein n=1 Tax=Apilactobacillus apisilvae TaxID=2923364 RepID=A0ABY4PJ03_9LACO|nr:LysM peptidoglycan-binding domain-containing protein [Apilactobacillus apisilvae]